jgi:hypothetical protein
MEFLGTVENGVVKLPADTRLPEGAVVRVTWEPVKPALPIETEPMDREALLQDLAWATGARFAR